MKMQQLKKEDEMEPWMLEEARQRRLAQRKWPECEVCGRDIGGFTTTLVYTYTSPGDFVGGRGSYFPVGTTAVSWYGAPVGYFRYDKYDWRSQENIVDEKSIVMFPSPRGQRVSFGGIHVDPYTGREY